MDINSYDSTVAAVVLWREARGVTSIQRTGAYRGIMHVILNRIADPRWPDTIRDVVFQPYQFSSFNFTWDKVGKKMTCDPNAVKWPQERNAGEWPAFLEACAVVNDPGSDPTGGANHYHDTSIDPPYKAWLGAGATLAELEKCRTARIGPLVFYRILR